MDEDFIRNYIRDYFANVYTTDAYGGTFYSVDPEIKFPFATIMYSGEFDTVSDLSRPSVYRLNIGVSKTTFRELFPEVPAVAETIDLAQAFDYTALDQIMPHPDYGRMYWVCVLNPGDETFKIVQSLLAEAYTMDVERYQKKLARVTTLALPEGLSKPAQRALAGAGITRLQQLTQYSQSELLQLHGLGPSTIPKLQQALSDNGLAFRSIDATHTDV